jgi:hypothetical protein
MNYSSVKPEIVMVNNIANHSNMKYCYHTPKTVNGQQYGPLLCQTSNSNGQQYSQPQQYEPLLSRTSNSNGQQYNSHNNMNHSSVKHQTVMVNNITATKI